MTRTKVLSLTVKVRTVVRRTAVAHADELLEHEPVGVLGARTTAEALPGLDFNFSEYFFGSHAVLAAAGEGRYDDQEMVPPFRKSRRSSHA